MAGISSILSSLSLGVSLAASVVATAIQQQAVFGAADWAQFGALGLFSATVLYLHNQQNKQHREDIKNLNNQHKLDMQKERDDRKEEAERNRTEYKDLLERSLDVAEATRSAIENLSSSVADVHRVIDAQKSAQDILYEIKSSKRERVRYK